MIGAFTSSLMHFHFVTQTFPMWDTSDDDNISCMCISHIEDIAKVSLLSYEWLWISSIILQFIYRYFPKSSNKNTNINGFSA